MENLRSSLFLSFALLVAGACNRGADPRPTSETTGTAEPSTPANAGATGAEARPAAVGKGVTRRYDVERGLIEYAVDGMEVGTETMRFKNYGLLEVKHKESKMQLPPGLDLPAGALPGHKKLVSIIDGSTIINYDPTTKTGTKTLNSLELLGGAKRFAGKSMVDVGQEMYAAMGGVKTGTKTIAGQSCDVWKIDKLSTESCVHKGITLEVSTELVGMKQHSVATKIDWTAPIDDSAFVVPADVTLRETDLSKQKLPPGLGSALPSQGLPGKTGKTISPEDALRLLRQGTEN
jgi:hypothetical protein